MVKFSKVDVNETRNLLNYDLNLAFAGYGEPVIDNAKKNFPC